MASMENTMPQTLNKVLHDPFIFLAHAVRLEEEAAAGFSELADAMDTLGNPDAAEFFRRMAEFSRRHLAQARARVGARPLPELGPMEWEWPDGASPERAGWRGVDGLMGVDAALDLALESENRGQRFYAQIAQATDNAKIRSWAEEFAAEEAEHVRLLEEKLARLLG